MEAVTFQATLASPPSGTKILVDTTADGEAQVIKIGVSADTSTALCPVDASTGMLVNAKQTTHDDLNLNANVQVANADASVSNPVPVKSEENVHELTLSLDTSAYAIGDVLADTQELASFLAVSGRATTIQSITVLDEDDQGGSFDIIFLKSNASLGTENSAPNISDTNAREVMGYVSVVGGDYIDLGGSRIATLLGIGLVVKASSTSIWVGAISRDAKTYSASGLKLKIGVV